MKNIFFYELSILGHIVFSNLTNLLFCYLEHLFNEKQMSMSLLTLCFFHAQSNSSPIISLSRGRPFQKCNLFIVIVFWHRSSHKPSAYIKFLHLFVCITNSPICFKCTIVHAQICNVYLIFFVYLILRRFILSTIQLGP